MDGMAGWHGDGVGDGDGDASEQSTGQDTSKTHPRHVRVTLEAQKAAGLHFALRF